MLVEARCAITTRVAPSFVRVGHLDLFARRVEMIDTKLGDDDGDVAVDVKKTSQYKELRGSCQAWTTRGWRGTTSRGGGRY